MSMSTYKLSVDLEFRARFGYPYINNPIIIEMYYDRVDSVKTAPMIEGANEFGS
jgi:hypothetical protein